MSKIIFTESQKRELESNPNIVKVSDRSIQIFVEHGFDLSIIGSGKPKQCIERWRGTFQKYGEEGFYTERRRKSATGRPFSKELSPEDKLKKAEARIAYLEAELDFVKKLDELERQPKKKK